MTAPDAPLNPVQIEQNIRACAERIHKGVTVTTDAEREAKRLRREYDAAHSRAYLDHQGPAHEKKYAAELATQDEREAAETAEIAQRYAERTARAVEAELRAWQSVGASVRLMYGVETGVGR
ncbi:hypothetical protein SAMN05216215_110719 [Saccharopolyspora shandongensis]|uniref:Uncharacterized protein n=1 Tax=Saccharopolyspora shandongensis TaxID=418495 RepID=A0A1H3U492_9PSEU|nr:hypothetical protein [Saccharopolyspora shandongensis]SDZ57283.1 hypothetical protein SAMN05216215_110719 [Saccharopolyspora shandongensis]